MTRGARALQRSSRYRAPARRRLRVFSLDPTYSRLEGSTAVLSVPWEPLRPGPVGERIAVEDLGDGGAPRPQVDLDDPHLLAQDGLAPDEHDPEFRQQMLYAVSASLLDTVDQARGRRLRWHNVWRTAEHPGARPRAMPAEPQGAGRVANAFYRPGHGLSFGAFTADVDDGSGLFPGQTVYGCLSHDIVNHEVAHAVVHELRPWSIEPLGPDALAFHEGFADIVAILQHFRLPGLLETQLARTGSALWDAGPLVELAGEFGRGSGRDGALRRALGDDARPARYGESAEPHERGAVLVAAFFDAFFAAYRHRIADLERLAGRSGPAAGSPLPHDLASRVAREARSAATTVLGMVLRAFDYLPPAGITFTDFLDAVVVADTDLYPEDADGFRRSLVECCRRRGIYPGSLTADARTAAAVDSARRRAGPLPTRQALLLASHDLHRSRVGGRRPNGRQLDRSWTEDLLRWGVAHADLLGLDPAAIAVDGGNASFRSTQDGTPTAVVTARFTARNTAEEELVSTRLGGVQLVGGATVIADGDGTVRHVVRKPPPTGQSVDAVLAFVDECAQASGLDAGEREADAAWMHTVHAFDRVHARGRAGEPTALGRSSPVPRSRRALEDGTRVHRSVR